MNELINVAMLGGIALLALFTIGFIFSRLYQRASKEKAFVRTGLGGQKVVMDGGAIKLPVFHELIWVNMNTLKLEVQRSGRDSLFTRDRMRIDVVAAFFVRVSPNVEGIASAAQTLGVRTLDPEQLKDLVEDKFVDALRAASVSMTMQELLDKRQDFIQAVQNAVSEDLTKNGLELESVSLTSFDQTKKEHFNPENAFDAEGLTRLTEETQKRAKERNEIEQETAVAIAKRNYEATQQKLTIEKDQRFATLAQQQEVSTREAEQAAQVAAFQAQRKRESEEARIMAERQVQEAEVARERAVQERQIEKDRAVQVAKIEQNKTTEIADQEKAIAIARKSEEQSQAEAKANAARAEAVKSEQAVVTAAAVAEAERVKEVAVVEARQEAEKLAIGVKVAAEAERETEVAERRKAIELIAASQEAERQGIRLRAEAEAEKASASDRSAARRIEAEGDAEAEKIRALAARLRYEIEAEGTKLRNEAINTLSTEQIAMNVRLKLIEHLPSIIAESVKPMEKIDGIKIFQVDGLARNGAPAEGGGNGASGSLAEQAVSAALSYRTQPPLIDALMKELGIQGASLSGLAGVVQPEPKLPAPTPAGGEAAKV